MNIILGVETKISWDIAGKETTARQGLGQKIKWNRFLVLQEWNLSDGEKGSVDVTDSELPTMAAA